MTTKQYQYVRVAVAMLIAITTSIAINLKNYLLPLIAVIIGLIILNVSRKKIKGVLADERDYNLAGTAARYSLTIFVSLMAISVLVLFALKDKNPETFTNLAMLFAYLICGLMLTNSIVFYFLKAKASSEKQGLVKGFKHYIPFLLLALIVAFILTFASLRMFTPEDEWICDNGSWTKHGNPSAAMPTEVCR